MPKKFGTLKEDRDRAEMHKLIDHIFDHRLDMKLNTQFNFNRPESGATFIDVTQRLDIGHMQLYQLVEV